MKTEVSGDLLIYSQDLITTKKSVEVHIDGISSELYDLLDGTSTNIVGAVVRSVNIRYYHRSI